MKYIFYIFTFFFIVFGICFLILKPNKYDFKSDINGTQISLKSFNGKYKAVYFGYLYCPDVCPTSLSLISNALDKLNRDDFEVIFITLDPERDSNDDLTQMAQNFYKNAVGLKVENLEKVTKNYGVKYKKIPMPDSAMGYSVAHSSSIYLLDKNGKFFTEISNLTPDNISENLEQLISKRP
ncbi:cytochrome oxidase copper insertion factor, SCO1/SenC/PrrC family [Campylobacter mucosalis]|uniref:SCO family protein n=1 Tax=Campylobacter mucosalis TaxID=202 RepID=UPI000555849D|nr:SCO family protein [Campylobacter mucosalis]QKF62756.1 cytochrome oxidase copper insertion factor, SCO1/SenC/PrrC family [Campylobacter mucosalis]